MAKKVKDRKSHYSPQEKKALIEEMRKRKRAGGPGAMVDLAPERGPFMTSATSGALTKLGEGAGALLNEWDERMSTPMPEVPGVPVDPDAPRFSPVFGGILSKFPGARARKVRRADDAALDRRMKDLVKSERKVQEDAELFDGFKGERRGRQPEATISDFDEAIRAADAFDAAPARPPKRVPFVPKRDELTLFYKLRDMGKTAQQAETILKNRRLLQP